MPEPKEKPIFIPVITPLLVAVQFMTQLPPLIRRPFTDKEMGRAVAYFPMVGLVLGAVLVLGQRLLTLVFPPTVVAVLVLALWVLVTGALHLDGWLDACDGLFGGFTPEKRMEIMKDERVGAFGLAGGVLLMLTKLAALYAVSSAQALLLAPLLARWILPFVMVIFPYARKQGLGSTMKEQVGGRELALATALTLAAAWLIAGPMGLAAFGLLAVLAWLGGKYVLTKIPGLTGDIYGAFCELGETLVLLFLAMEVF